MEGRSLLDIKCIVFSWIMLEEVFLTVKTKGNNFAAPLREHPKFKDVEEEDLRDLINRVKTFEEMRYFIGKWRYYSMNLMNLTVLSKNIIEFRPHHGTLYVISVILTSRYSHEIRYWVDFILKFVDNAIEKGMNRTFKPVATKLEDCLK